MSDPITLKVREAISENLLHFIWRFQYFNRSQLYTAGGENIEVIFPGLLNAHQGPDFKDAKIRIGTTLLAGSIEIHINTSDWIRHGHEHDTNYSNVILHVVFKNDMSANNIPVLELGPYISKIMLQKYRGILDAHRTIPCSNFITKIRDLTWLSWKERLLAERLTRKSGLILHYLKENNAHWEESFWWLLARNFGMKVNGDLFESIAKSIPLTVLAKQKAQIHQLEGLLLGQANLLQKEFQEDYPKLLQREYAFLKKKYNLKPVVYQAHFLRMRPGNFPTVRLAQLAMLVHKSEHLFSRMLESESIEEIKSWLRVTANDYWHYHYLPDEPSLFKQKTIGINMIESIIINSLAPALFAYGLYHQEERFKSKAIHWLEQLPAERNSIIYEFMSLNVSCKTACDSQSLIELKNEYCDKKRCLDCSVGNCYLSDR